MKKARDAFKVFCDSVMENLTNDDTIEIEGQMGAHTIRPIVDNIVQSDYFLKRWSNRTRTYKIYINGGASKEITASPNMLLGIEEKDAT